MVLMALAGQLKFPQSGEYDNNLDCVWHISAPFGTVSTFAYIVISVFYVM